MWINIKVKEHLEYKNKLLEEINKSPSEFDTKKDIVTHDHFINKSKKVYLKTFNKLIKPYIDELSKDFNLIDTNFKLKFEKVWFQKYRKAEFHNWHVHPKSNLIGIYYLQNNHPTEFYDIINKKTGVVKVEEGDMLICSPYYPHRSLPNTTNNDKVIIGFNLNII